MSNQAALNPRFSVKASFAGNIIDASDNEFATQKARNYPKSSGRCAVNAAQPQIEVQVAAPARRMQELGVPTQEDRQHWGGRNVVYQSRKTDTDLGKVTNTPVKVQLNQAAPQRRQVVQAKGVPRPQAQVTPTIRQQTHAPAANPNNRAFGQKMGQRQVAIQRAQRETRNGPAVNAVSHDANSFVATVPHELLEGDSFTLEMPQGVWGGNVVRPHQLAQDADRYADQELEDHDATEEAAAVVNRNHWRGKTIVQQQVPPQNQIHRQGAQRCAAVQQPIRQVVSGPGCQARQQALKKGEVAIRAVPKKIVRQSQQQVVQQQVQARRRAEPVKKAGACPCAK
jgi:hypothetical protein